MITVMLTGEREVAARLDKLNEATKAELKVGIGRLTLKLVKRVRDDKLSGQVLAQKTGRLKRSIAKVVIDEGDKVAGIVSTPVVYGIGWELGWPGGGVRASLDSAKAKFAVGGGSGFKNGAPKQRSFLLSALRDLEGSGDIATELQAAVARAIG